jgi:site-specific DNA recombinase
MKAGIYLRVSTPGQAEDDKASLGEQEQRCRHHCEAKAYPVVAVYSDIGSGASKKRPQFQQMLRDTKAGMFDVIVAWKADRLARGISPCAALYEALENTNVAIETVTEPFDRTTFEIRAVLGRMEMENIAQRTQMGREGNIKAGKHHVKPPFGYDYDFSAKRWAINAFEARWVCHIFDWYVAGVSPNEIARRLNSAGAHTKRRSRLGWTPQRVSSLVNSECYAGVAYFNKRLGRTDKPKDKSEWIQMKDVPAIIDKETWEAAQAERASNKRFSPRNTQAVYLTQNVLFCEECGYRFRIKSHRGGARLLCGGMTTYPHLFDCRTPKSLPETTQSERLWGAVAAVVGSESGLEIAIRSRTEYAAAERETIKRQLKELQQRHSDVKGEQDRVITGFRKGYYNEQQLDRQLRAIEAEAEQYACEEDRLLADLSLQEDADTVYRRARQLIPVMRDRLSNSLSAKERREIIGLLVRRALLDREGNMTVEFKVPTPEGAVGCSTSPHEGSPRHRPGCGHGHGPAPAAPQVHLHIPPQELSPGGNDGPPEVRTPLVVGPPRVDHLHRLATAGDECLLSHHLPLPDLGDEALGYS